MTLEIFTARMGCKDPDALDVTWLGNIKWSESVASIANVQRFTEEELVEMRKGGHRGVGRAFAPSPGLFWPYVRKRQLGLLTDTDWTEFEVGYTAEMRRSYRDRRRAWDTVLGWERVVLLCFCNSQQCHRLLLAEILARCGGAYAGELAPPPPRQPGLWGGEE